MRTKSKFLAGALMGIVALVFAANAAVAQDDGEDRDRVWKQMETMRILKLTEVLEPSDEQLAKIIPVVKSYAEAQRTKMAERDAILRELEGMGKTGASPESTAVRANIKKILEIENAMMGVRRTHYDQMEKLLDARQMARYMLFEVRFHDEVQGFMSDLKRRHDRRMRRYMRGGPGGDGEGSPDGAPPPEPK
ncbi:MAG: hypothetical protein IT350_01280 [Deltaproteobacteria bacterium]|nr:hypothetical protein [Deltaproteobacteria bacterium]